MSTQRKLIEIKNLIKYFPITKGIIFQKQVGFVHAVDDISIDIYKGETLGLVGESGCGKSTAGRTILQIYKPLSGKVLFKGRDLVELDDDGLRKMRKNMQMIFQDPYASLNPRMKVKQIISEPMKIHDTYQGKELAERVEHLMTIVGLNPSCKDRYPFEFSGGQRQRIGIARALALEPEFIVCDEPISALDVSIQAQIVNLLQDLQEEFNLTLLFIAHDLSMVEHISDRVAVMYLGNIVELADRDELYLTPLHPYTNALLSAIPIPDPIKEENRQRVILEGDVPSSIDPPSGCAFRTRCPLAGEICMQEKPQTREITPGHFVACHKV